MNKDQNLINEFAIKTLKENLNVMYAQIWREGQLTAEYKRMPVKTRLNTWSACKGVVSCAVGIALDEGLIQLDAVSCESVSRSARITSITRSEVIMPSPVRSISPKIVWPVCSPPRL